MSLLLLFPSARTQITGAGGITSVEAFGAGLNVAPGALSFAGTGESYLWSVGHASTNWTFSPIKVASARTIRGCGRIVSTAAIGRPTIGGILQMDSFYSAKTISRPVVSRSFIVQDEEFLMLYA